MQRSAKWEREFCGRDALKGVPRQLLINENVVSAWGENWTRAEMMNAAIAAYRLGYMDAAVNAAIWSQIDNDPVYQLLSDHRYLIQDWFRSR